MSIEPQKLREKVAGWHRLHFCPDWLAPVQAQRFAWGLIALFGLIAIIANVSVRSTQYDVWQRISAQAEISDSFLFSTADAPYFIGISQAIHSTGSPDSFLRLRHYPNQDRQFAAASKPRDITEAPLLSVVLAKMAGSGSPSALMSAGHHLLFFSIAVTGLAIILAFGATGYWIEGTVAAIGGGLSSAFLMRSSIGRVDTDQLNLGFIYLLFALVMLCGRARSPKVTLLAATAAGFTGHIMLWWYSNPELVWMAIIALIVLRASLHPFSLISLISVALVIVISGVTITNPFDSTYVKNVVALNAFSFPNTLETITEVRKVDFAQLFISATGSVELGIVALVGLAMWAARHPVMAISYGPLVILGLLNFVIGNRAIFYSAPILWFGIGFFVASTFKFVLANAVGSFQHRHHDLAISALTGLICFAIAWTNSPTNYVPQFSFSQNVLTGFQALKPTKPTADKDDTTSVVATWWDYGYASMMLNGLPTLHDGGSQTTPTTHFFASSLLEDSHSSTVGTIRFLAEDGEADLSKQTSRTGLQQEFNLSASDETGTPIYLVLTNQMSRWIGSISKIANWDIEAGKPINLPGLEPGEPLQYYPINCRLNGFPQTLACQGVTFDLERGLMNGQPGLVGWTHSHDGEIVRQKSFDNDGYFAVQLVQIGPQLTIYLVHRQLYESTFNELFHFGQIDDPSITLHYDDYPHIRIYKISGDGR